MNKFDSTSPLAKYRVNFFRLAWLSILFLLLPVFFIASGAIDIKEDLFLIFPFIIVPVGISIYRVILLVLNFDLEILLYNGGFSYSNKGETRNYSWKEIDKIWTTKFELISIIYIKYIKVKILDTSGNTIILDRTLQNVEKFEAIVQEQVAREKFPQAITMLQQGAKMEFGGITLTKDYIKNKYDTILWSELGDLQTWQGTIRLWKKGKQAISMIVSISSTPNFFLLISLIQYLSNNLQASSPPLQDLTNDRNMASAPNTPTDSKKGIHLRPGGNTDARLSGLFIFLLGAGLGYWQIVLPIRDALRGEPYVSYFTEATLLVPFAIFFGLFLLVFGADGLGFLSKPSSKFGLVLFIIGIIVFILACHFGMQFIMRGLGYY